MLFFPCSRSIRCIRKRHAANCDQPGELARLLPLSFDQRRHRHSRGKRTLDNPTPKPDPTPLLSLGFRTIPGSGPIPIRSNSPFSLGPAQPPSPQLTGEQTRFIYFSDRHYIIPIYFNPGPTLFPEFLKPGLFVNNTINEK